MTLIRNTLIALCAFALAMGPVANATAQVADLLASISAALEAGDSSTLAALLEDVEDLSAEDQAAIAAELIALAEGVAASNPALAALFLNTASALAANIADSDPVLAGDLGVEIKRVVDENQATLGVTCPEILTDACDVVPREDPEPPPPPPPPPENPNITDPDINTDLDPSPTT